MHKIGLVNSILVVCVPSLIGTMPFVLDLIQKIHLIVHGSVQGNSQLFKTEKELFSEFFSFFLLDVKMTPHSRG